MGRSYTIGCPGISTWEYGLMFLGGIALLFLATFAYQLGVEKFDVHRAVRRRRLSEAEGD